MDQEEETYGFHPWALSNGNGIECGGGKYITQGAEGEQQGGEESAFDGDSYWSGDNDEEVKRPPSRVGR